MQFSLNTHSWYFRIYHLRWNTLYPMIKSKILYQILITVLYLTSFTTIRSAFIQWVKQCPESTWKVRSRWNFSLFTWGISQLLSLMNMTSIIWFPWKAMFGKSHLIVDILHNTIFRCCEAPIYEGLSVHLSVRPLVRPSVRNAFSLTAEKTCFLAPYAVYPALF